MRRLIIENADVVIPPENYALGITPLFSGFTSEDWREFCRKIISTMSGHVDWIGFGIDKDRALELLWSIPETDRNGQGFWHAFHAIYANSIGKPNIKHWGDKTPLNIGRLDNILQTFPDAKFVFMVRDVFDTSYSYGCVETPKTFGKFLDGAKRWVDANQRVIAFSEERPGQSIIVKYEDLVTDPEIQINRVLHFLGLERHSNSVGDAETKDIMRHKHLHNVLGVVRDDFIGKGRSNLSADTQHQILALARDIQKSLGYAYQ